MSELPDFAAQESWVLTKTLQPGWKLGSGATDDEWTKHKKIEIDPYGEGRTSADNYKTLISAIVPRPIGFVSSESSSGVRNLAPFSYFSVANSDPPIFTIGISNGRGNLKDTAANILETGELTINIISEWFVEAANFASVDAPTDVDEFELSGLTPLPSSKVKPPHVAESAFSIEAKLIHTHLWKSKSNPERTTGSLLIVEGVNFHAREDIINKELNTIDIDKLKPVSRLGGITYGRVVSGYENPRPVYDRDVADKEADK